MIQAMNWSSREFVFKSHGKRYNQEPSPLRKFTVWLIIGDDSPFLASNNFLDFEFLALSV